MKRIFKLHLLIVVIAICTQTSIHSQTTKNSNEDTYSRHSIDFSPFTPLGDVYSLQYNYRFSKNDELITGLSYVNIKYKDVGNNSAPGVILGYRRFLWKNLHVQYELWPGYDNFYEQNEDKHYKGFQLWNEFRLGYQFNFKIKSQETYITLQWPLGFYLIKGDKPKSFVDYEKENRFFYNIPLVYVGMKF